jgi:hypothetical protein
MFKILYYAYIGIRSSCTKLTFNKAFGLIAIAPLPADLVCSMVSADAPTWFDDKYLNCPAPAVSYSSRFTKSEGITRRIDNANPSATLCNGSLSFFCPTIGMDHLTNALLNQRIFIPPTSEYSSLSHLVAPHSWHTSRSTMVDPMAWPPPSPLNKTQVT